MANSSFTYIHSNYFVKFRPRIKKEKKRKEKRREEKRREEKRREEKRREEKKEEKPGGGVACL